MGSGAGNGDRRMISVTLPWPDRLLHPNARPHWAAKAKAVKSARVKAGWAVTAETNGRKWPEEGASVSVTFRPPDQRKRDLDGMISAHKAAQDGIADALGVDDCEFQCTYAIGEPVKGGAVLVTIQSI
jgi:crossover junction endodeoxyribonuclease RusA